MLVWNVTFLDFLTPPRRTQNSRFIGKHLFCPQNGRCILPDKATITYGLCEAVTALIMHFFSRS